MEMPSWVKWVAAGLVAAVVTTLAFFNKFGTPLIRGVIMIALGVAVLYFARGKLGLFSAVPYGLIVAGAIVLSNEYVVPSFRKVTTQ